MNRQRGKKGHAKVESVACDTFRANLRGELQQAINKHQNLAEALTSIPWNEILTKDEVAPSSSLWISCDLLCDQNLIPAAYSAPVVTCLLQTLLLGPMLPNNKWRPSEKLVLDCITKLLKRAPTLAIFPSLEAHLNDVIFQREDGQDKSIDEPRLHKYLSILLALQMDDIWFSGARVTLILKAVNKLDEMEASTGPRTGEEPNCVACQKPKDPSDENELDSCQCATQLTLRSRCYDAVIQIMRQLENSSSLGGRFVKNLPVGPASIVERVLDMCLHVPPSPTYQLALLVVADSLGQPAYEFIMERLWERSTERSLRVWSEIVVESSHYDDPGRCWIAVQEPFSRIISHDVSDTTSVYPLLRAVAHVLVRRGSALEIIRKNSLEEICAKIAKSFGKSEYWTTNDMDADEAEVVVEALRSMGIIKSELDGRGSHKGCSNWPFVRSVREAHSKLDPPFSNLALLSSPEKENKSDREKIDLSDTGKDISMESLEKFTAGEYVKKEPHAEKEESLDGEHNAEEEHVEEEEYAEEEESAEEVPVEEEEDSAKQVVRVEKEVSAKEEEESAEEEEPIEKEVSATEEEEPIEEEESAEGEEPVGDKAFVEEEEPIDKEEPPETLHQPKASRGKRLSSLSPRRRQAPRSCKKHSPDAAGSPDRDLTLKREVDSVDSEKTPMKKRNITKSAQKKMSSGKMQTEEIGDQEVEKKSTKKRKAATPVKKRTPAKKVKTGKNRASTSPSKTSAGSPTNATQITNFPTVLYQLLDETKRTDVVSWQAHGLSFCIHKKEEFINTVAPDFFDMKPTWMVFRRHLIFYGFVYSYKEKSFRHESFKRNHSELVSKVTRREAGEKSWGKKNLDNFPAVLHRMVDETDAPDVVSWQPDGLSFVIFDQEQFLSDVVANYLPMVGSWKTFKPYMTRYGFEHSPIGSKHIFWHAYFQRDHPGFLSEVIMKEMPKKEATPPPEPFPIELYKLLEKNDAPDIISWESDGCSFTIYNTKQFVAKILPGNFKDVDDYFSFQKSLSSFGFSNDDGNENSYRRNWFKRGCLEDVALVTVQSDAHTFPLDVYRMLDDESTPEIFSWTPNGESFAIYSREEFEATVLPKHFGKMSKWNSFRRKLDRYAFRRIQKGGELGMVYGHPLFKKNKREDAAMITPPILKPALQKVEFPILLYNMLKDCHDPRVCSWEPDGESVIFRLPFETKVMPKYFKTMKGWNSFRNQLLRYGFTHKGGTIQRGVVYGHDFFKKHDMDQVLKIKRKWEKSYASTPQKKQETTLLDEFDWEPE